MKENKNPQFQPSEAVVDVNQIPERFIKSIGTRILEILKSDPSYQERFEAETGKKFYK